LPFSILNRGRKVWDDSVLTFISEIRSNVRVIATSLMRIDELKSGFRVNEEELRSRVSIALNELRNLRELLEDAEGKVRSLDGEVHDAIRVIEAYSVISDREGADFLFENTDRILRAARWCDGALTKFLKEHRRTR